MCKAFLCFLTIFLIVLKMTGYIVYSWWIVLLALWGALLCFLFVAADVLISNWYVNHQQKKLNVQPLTNYTFHIIETREFDGKTVTNTAIDSPYPLKTLFDNWFWVRTLVHPLLHTFFLCTKDNIMDRRSYTWHLDTQQNLTSWITCWDREKMKAKKFEIVGTLSDDNVKGSVFEDKYVFGRFPIDVPGWEGGYAWRLLDNANRVEHL